MLDEDNAGLKHVRSLILTHANEHSNIPDEIEQYPDAAQLVYRLPKNVLTNFE